MNANRAILGLSIAGGVLLGRVNSHVGFALAVTRRPINSRKAEHPLVFNQVQSPCASVELTDDGCESFSKILHQLNPGGDSGKPSAQSLKKRRDRRPSRPALAGNLTKHTAKTTVNGIHEILLNL